MKIQNNQDQQLKNYIDAFTPIEEGRRNHALHNAGLLLRKNFGLTGVSLVSALSAVNRKKCEPPLPDSEVIRISQSVDKSDIPVGEKSIASNKQREKKAPKPTYQTVYTVSVPIDSVSVADLLQKKVCIYQDCLAKVPRGTYSISEVLERFKTGGQAKDLIEAVRSETNKEVRNRLKQQLPAVIFASEPQTERKATACKPNGILCLDFDGIPVDELEVAKVQIAAVPFVFAVGVSVSGNGLFALVAYEEIPDLKTLLSAMQADFPYGLDKSCSDISRLRFVTQDENLIVKDEVFPAILTEWTEPVVDPDDSEVTTGTSMAWERFPIWCLPPVLRNFCLAAAKATNTDPAYTATFVLPVVASAIGSHIVAEVKRNWNPPAILWSLVVAPSGSCKTHTLRPAIKPLIRKQGEFNKQYNKAVELYEKEKKQYEADLIKSKRGHGDIPIKPEEPKRQFCYVSDTTTEMLIPILADNPYGVCSVYDEAMTFFGSLDAYRSGGGGKDEGIYNEVYDGGYVQVTRKTGDQFVAAERSHCSIGGGIQLGNSPLIISSFW